MDTSSRERNVPNAQTRAAMAEREAGQGQKFASVAALMDDLHADGDNCLESAKGFGCI